MRRTRPPTTIRWRCWRRCARCPTAESAYWPDATIWPSTSATVWARSRCWICLSRCCWAGSTRRSPRCGGPTGTRWPRSRRRRSARSGCALDDYFRCGATTDAPNPRRWRRPQRAMSASARHRPPGSHASPAPRPTSCAGCVMPPGPGSACSPSTPALCTQRSRTTDSTSIPWSRCRSTCVGTYRSGGTRSRRSLRVWTSPSTRMRGPAHCTRKWAAPSAWPDRWPIWWRVR